MLKNKTVVLGVTGSIAAYKMANVASMLVKLHADVNVIMTENATNFINPITFETLTGNKCLVDTFDRNFQYSVEHVSLAKKADVVMLAPASANVIGKIAHGIADDMLSTTVMATRAPVLVAPAMNTGMWENAAVQQNIKTLRARGVEIVAPVSGHLACGDNGAGKLEDVAVIAERACELLFAKKDMEGLRVMVTAGPSREALDPVRYISNRSSGKMGYAIAQAAQKRGAEVTLLSGPVAIEAPQGVKLVPFMDGGAQEKNRRAGTSNVPGIVGMGEAAQLAAENMETAMAKVAAVRDHLIARIEAEIPYAKLNGHRTNRLPGNVNFCFRFIEGESMLMLLDAQGVCASSGSACTSGSLDPSHVLLAIGCPHEIAHGSLRLSLSEETTMADADFVVDQLKEIIPRLRSMSPLYADFIAKK